MKYCFYIFFFVSLFFKTLKNKNMKNLYRLIVCVFFSTFISGVSNSGNSSENKQSDPDSSDYVKGRSMFVNTELMKIAVPLGFSEDNNYVLGAIYNLDSKTFRADFLSKPVFFASSIDATSWEDIIDENNSNLVLIKFYGKFLVSIEIGGGNDLCIVEFENGKFSKPVRLPEPINSVFLMKLAELSLPMEEKFIFQVIEKRVMGDMIFMKVSIWEMTDGHSQEI